MKYSMMPLSIVPTGKPKRNIQDMTICHTRAIAFKRKRALLRIISKIAGMQKAINIMTAKTVRSMGLDVFPAFSAARIKFGMAMATSSSAMTTLKAMVIILMTLAN
jgi:hypothetical protein